MKNLEHRTLMVERILGIITPAEGKGKGSAWGGPKKFALVFTSDRLVIVKLAGFLALLGGAIGGIGGIYDRMVTKKPEELLGMSIEDILKDDKDNYAIPYSEIVKVVMKKGGFISDPTVFFNTAKKKHLFVFTKENGYNNCLNLVRATMPDKL